MLNKEEVLKLMKNKPNLSVQTYEDIENLNINDKNIISRQATINIGTIGHVAHGKSTLVKAISDVNTVKHKKEKVNNITIKLGYANAKIYKCSKCKSPEAFKSYSSDQNDFVKCDNNGCGNIMDLLRHVSFVDCPGHDILMATMLTGAAVMDYAFLLIAGNNKCPQNQTSEHLAAVEIMKLNKIIILQNKIDLIFKKENRKENYEEIRKFIKGTCAEKSPIIPISAQFKMNIDYILQYMCEYFPQPIRDLKSSPLMIIIRSFDSTKPGARHNEICGGIAGGSILRGVLRVGDEVEIKPGYYERDTNTGKLKCQSLKTRITSLLAEKNELLYAVPGGLIGVGTLLDPYLTRKDKLVGNIMGFPGQLFDVFVELRISYYLMSNLMGVKNVGNQNENEIRKLKDGEILMINVSSVSCGFKVIKENNRSNDYTRIKLLKPVCASIGEKVAISRKINKNWRLIGWGVIKEGFPIQN